MADRAFELARTQLLDIVDVGGGAVELLDDRSTASGSVLVISLDTAGLTPSPSGIDVRDRERFSVYVPSGFPFEPPSVLSAHRRWAGTPHVQYGRLLCLYLAPGVEWNPADGMRGLLTRLSEWLERAVAGTLDPDDQPLHPPVVYGQAASGRILVHPDLGRRVPWADDGTGASSRTLFGWAVGRGQRVDVLEWLDQGEAVDRAFDEDRSVFSDGHPYLVVPGVLIPGQFGSEFPSTARQLSAGLAEHGYTHEQLLWDLSTASLVNRQLRRRQTTLDRDAAGELWDPPCEPDAAAPDGSNDPGESDDRAHDTHEVNRGDDAALLTAMLVGTPSRRRAGGARLAHLAAWRLDPISALIANVYGKLRGDGTTEATAELKDIARRWFDESQVKWMRLMESRPEITNRRDRDTPAHWLAGRRVLVMGCGALGGPVAEFCARAGAAELTVADRSLVTPGILVRQAFNDADIGQAKATVLAERLDKIRPDLTVQSRVGDVCDDLLTTPATATTRTAATGAPTTTPATGGTTTTGAATRTASSSRAGDGSGEPASDQHPLTGFDLIIDATATASVRSALEYAVKGRATKPHVVTMVIGHRATRGLVTVNLGADAGAGAASFRKVALLAGSGAAGWDDVLDDVFPNPPRTEMFFPEPGCSAPTFVGSAAQTAALAGAMLDQAMTVLTEHAAGHPPVRRAGTADGAGEALPLTSFATAVRLGDGSGRGTSHTHWQSDLVEIDLTSGFEVRIAADALAEIRTEVRRGRRVRGELVETGGMLLGAFDDATGVIHIDRAAGPPPDSYLSANYFQHGVEGVQERVTNEIERTNGLSGFLGFWHTHPDGEARPSPTDEQGMASIVGPDGSRRRALMMILGAERVRWAGWRDHGFPTAPDVYVRVVPRTAGPVVAGHPGYGGGRNLQQLPPGQYFRGGFGGPAQTNPTAIERGCGADAADPATGPLSATTRPPWWRRLRGSP